MTGNTVKNIRKFLKVSYLLHLAALLFFVYVFALALKPLSDSDLWWHLKTGERILESGELPSEDLFSFTSPKPLPERQVRGMRSQWLGQAAWYLAYEAGGYRGLSVFRAMLIVFPFIALYLVFVKRGLHPPVLIAVASLPLLLILFSLYYTFERPQAFTFVLTLLLSAVLVRMRDPGGRLLWTAALAALMALWSNLHGMYIFGVALVAVFATGVLIEAALYREWRQLSLLLPCGLGVLATGANPNGFALLRDYFYGYYSAFFLRPAAAKAGNAAMGAVEILEFKPLWFFYREFHYVWPLFMIAFMVIAGAAILWKNLHAVYMRKQKARVPEMLAAATLIFFGLYHARGVTLCLYALPFFVFLHLEGSRNKVRYVFGGAAAVLSVVLLLVTLQRSPWQLKPSVSGPEVHSTYPEGAVKFLRANKIEGNMFNELRWGGYLIWRLYPGYRVFTDGRFVSGEVQKAYGMVRDAGPQWKAVLDEYRVDFILLRLVAREAGTITPLVLKFLQERPAEWRLVYTSGNTVLFLRDREKHKKTIARYALPIDILYWPILDISDALLCMLPGHPDVLLSKAVALYGLGRHAEAGEILRALLPSPVRDSYLKKISG